LGASLHGSGYPDRKVFARIPAFLGRFEYANVSIPMAILIWLMIYPMMLKVDFQSIRNVGKNPKGLLLHG
jgi:ACR3 family arsenite transporter